MLQPPTRLPVSNESALAIGIAGHVVTEDKGQKHVALIYRNAQNQPSLVHLGWHRKLYHTLWDSKYHWIEFSSIDIEVQETFADWVVLVASKAKDQPIPYSIIFNPSRNFDASGQFIDRSDGSGLTCATFILALFADAGMPLVEAASWPESRPGDSLWVEKILAKLFLYIFQHFPGDLSSFAKQYAQRMTLKRFRPEEVLATATLFAGVALPFSAVDPIARQLLSQVPP